MLHDPPGRTARALTLIEVLVSLAIIGLVMGLTLPALSLARSSGDRTRCLANLRSQGQAISGYRNDNDDLLPWAIYDMDVRLQWLDPMPAMSPYLDVEIPRLDEQGIVHTHEPWICPADDDEGLVDGVSYMYTPYDFMANDLHDNPGRIITLTYETNSWLPVMVDDLPLHAHGATSGGGQNALLIDGSVMPRSNIRK